MAFSQGGKDCNLIAYYNAGDDHFITYGKNRFLAQTFTLTATNVIYIARAKLDVDSVRREQHWSIYNTDGSGKPTGSPIYQTPGYSTRRTGDKEITWRRVTFDGFPQLPAGQYALVLSVPSAPDWMRYLWRRDHTSPTYSGGKGWLSHNAGVDWEEVDETDFMFEIWGWEPPPEPPPAPIISNWAPIDYNHTSLVDGFTIVVTTDIPVHLFMRWTTTEPLKHSEPLIRRGISLPYATRWCFVAWNENEQLEPGDTYIHTFEKRNWPVCQTRWFYFIGTKQAEETPSASPIFWLHREAEYEPSIYGPVAGTLSNRTIQYSWGTWPLTHDSPTGTILDIHDAPWYHVRCEARLSISYWIQRTFLFFDTSGIPPGSLIVAAVLSIFLQDKMDTSSHIYPYLCITQGVQSDPVVPTNYGDQLPYTTIGGQIDLRDMILNEYNHIDFNSDGLPWINIGGETRLCIRQEMDVINSPPPLGTNRAWWSSTQKGAGFEPLLTVYYVPP